MSDPLLKEIVQDFEHSTELWVHMGSWEGLKNLKNLAYHTEQLFRFFRALPTSCVQP